MKLLVSDGVDVQSVCHLGRAVPAVVKSALAERDRICVVPGCEVARGLEIDHYQVPFAEGGPSAMWNLARLCHWHHSLKTHRGFHLGGGPGAWRWSAPASAEDPSVEDRGGELAPDEAHDRSSRLVLHDAAGDRELGSTGGGEEQPHPHRGVEEDGAGRESYDKDASPEGGALDGGCWVEDDTLEWEVDLPPEVPTEDDDLGAALRSLARFTQRTDADDSG